MNRMENGHSCRRDELRLRRRRGAGPRTVAKAGWFKVAGEATEVLTARDGLAGGLGHREARRGSRQGGSWRQWTTDMADRQAGRQRRASRGLRKEGEDCGEEKEEREVGEGWYLYGREPDPVFFCLSYKTHVKFFISSLFPLFPSPFHSLPFPCPLPLLRHPYPIYSHA